MPVTARPSGVVLKYVLPALETWKAPHCRATRPSCTSCCAAVDDLGRLGAVVERALGDVRDVVLVDLAEIGGEGVRDPALLADPGDGDGRVEAAREGDADALADGQRLEDAAHRRSVVGGATGRAGRRASAGYRGDLAHGRLELGGAERALEPRPDHARAGRRRT